MLQILSSLTQLTRIDAVLSGASKTWVTTSGVTGTWVKVGKGTLPGDPPVVSAPATSGQYALPIWTESYRNGTAGSFSPDVSFTNQISLAYGKLRAVTDQVTGTPAAGTKLMVNADGCLQTAGSSDQVVAVAIGSYTNYTYLGKSYANVTEFLTI